MVIIKKNKNRKQNIAILITSIILISIIPVRSQLSTILSIENITLTHNQIKTAKVIVYNVNNLGSYKISISYNTSILQVIDVYKCEMYEVYSYKNTTNKILNISGYNISGITSNEICIAEIKFKAIGSNGSSCDLIIKESEILNAAPEPVEILHVISNGKATILTNDSSDDGSGNITPIAPIADASLSQRQGTINFLIIFNGSKSYDPDGNITGYRWDFNNDGNFDTYWSNNPTATYIYTKAGEYIVKLEVKDDDGQKDNDTIRIKITQPNKNPLAPTIVDGIRSGTLNIDYTFTVVSQDPDGDNIRYIFNWDDNTENTITSYVKNNTKINTTHNWSKAGIYIIKLQAEDINHGKSGYTLYELFIDIDFIKLDEINGYLIDNDQDGVYDQFFKLDSEEKIDLNRKGNETYLIDVDGDGNYDYQYNKINGLTVYHIDQLNDDNSSKIQDKDDGTNEINITIFLIIGILIAVLFIIFFLIIKKKR